MTTGRQPPIGAELIERLSQSLASSSNDFQIIETHISWVILFDQTALKLKKPISNPFLDYSTLELRHQACESELRLNRRYAENLYQSVVAIVAASPEKFSAPANGQSAKPQPLKVVDLPPPTAQAVSTAHQSMPSNAGHESSAEAIDGPILEFAVRMHRFDSDALLARQLDQGRVTPHCVEQLAKNVANFHASARVAEVKQPWGKADIVIEDAMDNFELLRSKRQLEIHDQLDNLHRWTEDFSTELRKRFDQRRTGGMIRECHGDLHLENIISWQGQLIPFDGIEFSDRLRWIDVQSDAAFTSMDLLFHGFPHLSHRFTNAYLEATGDYEGLTVLRWYQVYRALVRAKVALLRAQQESTRKAQNADHKKIADFVQLARNLTQPDSPRLFITHGPSGSGKTHGSQILVDRDGAIRIRSDVERKRIASESFEGRFKSRSDNDIYSASAKHATYQRLQDLARSIIGSGYSVVVDATFLDLAHRQSFARLALEWQVPFHIVSFTADEETLARRIVERENTGSDASDANLQVLQNQLSNYQPLLAEEMSQVINGNSIANWHVD